MKYLITGATGTIGALVTEGLLARGERPCVFVRDAKKARARFGRRVEIRVGDLSDSPAALTPALEGIDSMLLINSGTELAARDRTMSCAARAAGVHHIVKLSTLDVLSGVGTGPWHAAGEAAVRESGVMYTFIHAAAFMSNALSWAHAIRQACVVRSSTGQGKIAFIDPDDISEVVVEALLSRKYAGESLVITGPEALSYGEMAAKVGAAIGKQIGFEEISDADARRIALSFSENDAYAEALVDIWRAIREGRSQTVTDGVERVTARKPANFERWIQQNVDAFQ